MKKPILTLALALTLLLTGCTSMLHRSYLSVTPHNKAPAVEADSSASRVESYQELVNAISYQVSQAREEGVIRLHNYKRDVEGDLARACDEVSHNDPLGAYAVEGIRHSFQRIVTYYEATITISYRRSPEQIAGIVSVTGSGAIRGELQDTLSAFAPEAVLRVNYFNEDADFLRALLRQAYYDSPAAALGFPEAEITLYPDEGSQRIAEIALTYPADPDTLKEQSAALTAAAASLVEAAGPSPKPAALFNALRARQKAAPTPGSTAYAALVGHSADSEGLALAYQLLCDTAGLECTVVRGSKDGAPHFWNIVTTPDGPRHVDLSAADALLLTDGEMSDRNAMWASADYPVCGKSLHSY